MQAEHDLEERTKQFALRVIRLFGSLPKSSEAQVLGKQLLRSGTSVGANYREGFRGRSKSEFVANAATLCENSRNLPTGWSFLSTAASCRPTDSNPYGPNATS